MRKIFIALIMVLVSFSSCKKHAGPTPITELGPERLASVDIYDEFGVFVMHEIYLYDESGIFQSHIIEDNASVELERYDFEYLPSGSINRVSYSVNGSLANYSDISYDGFGRPHSFIQYDNTGAIEFTGNLTYDGSGNMTRKDVYDSGGAHYWYFVFSNFVNNIYTQITIYNPSGFALYTGQQEVMYDLIVRRYLYHYSNGLVDEIINEVDHAMKRLTGIHHYYYNPNSYLHSKYRYENGTTNLLDLEIDFYEWYLAERFKL